MNFYGTQHKHYCGVDLHARTMYVCIVSQQGVVLLHRNLPCDKLKFLAVIKPYRDDLVVGVECIYTWYWLADLCAKGGHRLRFGACSLHACHSRRQGQERPHRLPQDGGPASGRPDAAGLRLPGRDESHARSHAPPSALRAGTLLAHIQMTHHQYNLESPGKRISYRTNREGIGEGFEDQSVRDSIAADLVLVDQYEKVIGDLELAVLKEGRVHDPNAFRLLTTLPGDLERFSKS